jgi:hypothetical protein
MRPPVRRAIGHFRVLVDHALRLREPSQEHILHRMVMPLCADLYEVLEDGTRNDAWEVLEGFSQECQRIARVEPP